MFLYLQVEFTELLPADYAPDGVSGLMQARLERSARSPASFTNATPIWSVDPMSISFLGLAFQRPAFLKPSGILHRTWQSKSSRPTKWPSRFGERRWNTSTPAVAPENRSQILTYQWHQGLGDVFLDAGEARLAVQEFEAAIQAAPSEPLKTPVQKKPEQAKGQLK